MPTDREIDDAYAALLNSPGPELDEIWADESTGRRCRVSEVGVDTETLEPMVVYFEYREAKADARNLSGGGEGPLVTRVTKLSSWMKTWKHVG